MRSSVEATTVAQNGSAILHGETDCLENAGRRPAADYRRATSTRLCRHATCARAQRCSTSRIVIGENETPWGPRRTSSHGVELVRANDRQCVEMMTEFIAAEPQLWNEDIGEDAPAAFSPAAATPQPERQR